MKTKAMSRTRTTFFSHSFRLAIAKKGVDIMDESAKAARRLYEKEWRAKNPDKVKARNERYWAKRAAMMQQIGKDVADAEENKE